jgi:fructokinase
MLSSVSSPIVGIGELLWDLLPSGPRLGGAPTNFSTLSARLGESVALVSRIGQDKFGRDAMASLEAVAHSPQGKGHFDLTQIQVSSQLPTGTVTVTIDSDHRPHYTIDSPVAWDEITFSDELLASAKSASAKTASVVCFGTLAQRCQLSRESIRAYVEATSPQCVRVCDMNLRQPFCDAEVLHWCLSHATVLKISDEELPEVGRLLGIPSIIAKPAGDDVDLELTEWATESACDLLARAPQCRMVAITLGPHGSLLANREQAHRHDGFPTLVADTIGAGDAFTAGLVHAYVRQASLAQINTVSNLCGSYVASQQGATPELPPELLAKIRESLVQVAA